MSAVQVQRFTPGDFKRGTLFKTKDNTPTVYRALNAPKLFMKPLAGRDVLVYKIAVQELTPDRAEAAKGKFRLLPPKLRDIVIYFHRPDSAPKSAAVKRKKFENLDYKAVSATEKQAWQLDWSLGSLKKARAKSGLTVLGFLRQFLPIPRVLAR